MWKVVRMVSMLIRVVRNVRYVHHNALYVPVQLIIVPNVSLLYTSNNIIKIDVKLLAKMKEMKDFMQIQ